MVCQPVDRIRSHKCITSGWPAGKITQWFHIRQFIQIKRSTFCSGTPFGGIQNIRYCRGCEPYACFSDLRTAVPFH